MAWENMAPLGQSLALRNPRHGCLRRGSINRNLQRLRTAQACSQQQRPSGRGSRCSSNHTNPAINHATPSPKAKTTASTVTPRSGVSVLANPRNDRSSNHAAVPHFRLTGKCTYPDSFQLSSYSMVIHKRAPISSATSGSRSARDFLSRVRFNVFRESQNRRNI